MILKAKGWNRTPEQDFQILFQFHPKFETKFYSAFFRTPSAAPWSIRTLSSKFNQPQRVERTVLSFCRRADAL